MSLLDELAETIIEGDKEGIKEKVQKALDEGLEPDDILENGLMKGMEVVGKRFAADELFIPEVMLCARTMHTALEIIRPLLEAQDKKAKMKGKMVLGTVEGDIHDIGKSLVEMMFTANGFEVVDIGVNISPEAFVESIKQHQPNLVGMSALLTTTMPAITKTVEAIDKAGLRDGGDLKIIIGGAPVTEEFTEECGADLYGENALEGVEVAKKALGVS